MGVSLVSSVFLVSRYSLCYVVLKTSTIINQPPSLHQYSLLWVATPSATFHEKFLDQRLMSLRAHKVAVRSVFYNHNWISISDPDINNYRSPVPRCQAPRDEASSNIKFLLQLYGDIITIIMALRQQ